MSTVRTVVTSVLLVGASAVASCGDPLGPTDLAGDYVMTRIGSTSIPGTVRLSEGLEAFVVYDTIMLRADGTARISQRSELRMLPSGVVSTAATTTEWIFEVQASLGRIKLSDPPCPRPGVCDLSITDPIYFSMRGRDLVRDGIAGGRIATWSRRNPTTAR